jgi:hypothetical protein
MDLESLK